MCVCVYVCVIASENYISGQIFFRLDSDSVKEFGFEGSAYNILIAAQDEVNIICHLLHNHLLSVCSG